MASTTVTSTSVPGPRPTPLLGWRGNQLQFLRNPIGYMDAMSKTYGPVWALSTSMQRQIFAIGPEYNRLVLANQDLFYGIFDSVVPPLVARRQRGTGLLDLDSAEHKRQRRLVLPAFSRKHIEVYHDTIVGMTLEGLDHRWRGQTVRMLTASEELVRRILAQAVLGVDVATEDRELDGLIREMVQLRFSLNPLQRLPFAIPGTALARAVQTQRRFEDKLLELIQRKRAAGDEGQDMLAVMLRARGEDGRALTDLELLGHTRIVFIAGLRPLPMFITGLLLLLFRNPEVGAALVDELHGELHGQPPSTEQLNQLPLLGRVINEGLRLLPLADSLVRVSTGPFEIGPYRLPKDTIVTISPHHTHRLAELYPEPERFNPARWETIDPSPYEFMPFGNGPRMCIGASLAVMVAKLVLATILPRTRDGRVQFDVPPQGRLQMTVAG